MKNNKLIYILHFFTIAREIDMTTLSNRQITITLHDYERPWNEALSICEAHGGTLYVEDSNERSIVLEKYKSSSWGLSDHAFIGLHHPPVTGDDDVFAWTTCYWVNTYEHWKNSQHSSYANAKKCVLSDKSGGDWTTIKCDNDNKFICETEGSDCTFLTRTGTPTSLSDVTTVTITTTSYDNCQNRCMSQIHDLQNCWAVNYNAVIYVDNCVMYFVDDPFHFYGISLTSSFDIFAVKRCYTDAMDEDDDINVPNDDDKIPRAVCSSYHEQTTQIPDTTTLFSTQTQLTTSQSTSISSPSNTLPTSPTIQSSTSTVTTAATFAPSVTLTGRMSTTPESKSSIYTSSIAISQVTSQYSTSIEVTPTVTNSPPSLITSTTDLSASESYLQTSVATTSLHSTTAMESKSPELTSTPLSWSKTSTSTLTSTYLTTPSVKPTLTKSSTLPFSTSQQSTLTSPSSTTLQDTTFVHTTSTSSKATLSYITSPTTERTTTSQPLTSLSTSSPSETPSKTPLTTFVQGSTTTVSSAAKCNCKCSDLFKVMSKYASNSDWANKTTEEKVQDLVTRLRINKNVLSSTVRMKNSAKDNRTSSKSIGYLGIAILCGICGLLFISDGIKGVLYFFSLLK